MLKQRGLKTQVRTLIKERQKGSAYQGHFFSLQEKNKTKQAKLSTPFQ